MHFSSLRNCGTEKEFAARAAELAMANPDRKSLDAILAEAIRNKRFATGKMIKRVNKTIEGYVQLKRQGLGSEVEGYIQIALIEGKTKRDDYVKRFCSSR